jgi:tetratricopeptide (TPR) repeat protein
MPAWREEMVRHGRLAHELRLPAFQWYTPLWSATEAMLAGRYEEAAVLADEAEESGQRAGDRNAQLFANMVRFCARIEREAYEETDFEFVAEKIANSPTGISYRGSYAWILAGLGETERAREELRAAMTLPHPFDANWLSFQAECAEAAVLTDDAPCAATLYERLTPFAGRPATAGRAVLSFGAIDRHLGGLAAVLGRTDDAIHHLENAIRLNEALGCTVWRGHAERHLLRIAAAGPLAN